jgi:hypothetical protein
MLRAVALRLKAGEEIDALRAAAAAGPAPEVLRSARATLGRASALDAALTAVIDEAEASASSEAIRSWTRTRFRLLRMTADLWLMQDSPKSDRRDSRG